MASKQKPLPIQVGTIVYNETARLPEWLDYWKKIADRIVVLDQGSNDGTQDMLNKSGVVWHERLPRGNPDIHWNDLIGISKNNKPFFRLGVDEFITRKGIKHVLKTMKAHPQIQAWWMKRLNWISGIDVCKHPEAKRMLGDDWQLIVSVGRPYSFNGRMHNWPQIHVPGDMIGYIDGDKAQIDHRRTLQQIIDLNDTRAHHCRLDSGQDQEWFKNVCTELVERYGNVPAPE